MSTASGRTRRRGLWLTFHTPACGQTCAGVSFTQGWLDAGGVRTRYLSSGDPSKPLLLLIHGTGGHAEAYVRNLGPHAEQLLDGGVRPGGARLDRQAAIPYEIKDYAEHTLAVMKALGRERALVSGESLGGWIATWLAVHHPTPSRRSCSTPPAAGPHTPR